MLAQFPVHPSVAASDLERARRWYAEKLGLIPEMEDPGGLWFHLAGDTWLYVYASTFAGTARNTVAGWSVQDIESVMAGLRARGVVFEDYDFGDIKTEDGLADFGTGKAAWFKDSEGNTLEIAEVVGGSPG
jgi:catechol 2,3-dioxygenase-like lactoylglutathione lyase family enzyme